VSEMVKSSEIEELIRLLNELRNEMDWAERADKPLPPNCVDTPEKWYARCEEGRTKALELLSKVKALIDRIYWSRIEP